jgi:cytochrome c oxidase subunit 2
LNDTKRRRAVFLVAALALAALCVAARADDPLHLMPESASNEANEIDGLTYLILWITGITFFLVQGLLVVFLFKYRAKAGQKAKYTHGNHAVELVWTVTPALILVFLALWQMKLWLRLKSPKPEENQNPVQIEILAKQFEWNFRYPSADRKSDKITSGVLVVPVNRPVNANLRSMDVIHSFYLPNVRFKQDAVPGLKIGLWFKPTVLSANRRPVPDHDGVPQNLKYWDIVCAELCGVSHTTMKGYLYVVTEEQFENWLKDPALVPEIPVKWVINKGKESVETADQLWARWDWQEKQYVDKVDAEGKPVLDADGRPVKVVLMPPAKLKREPFGEDEKAGGGAGDDKEGF